MSFSNYVWMSFNLYPNWICLSSIYNSYKFGISSPRWEASLSLWLELKAWIFYIDLETLRWSLICFKLDNSLTWLLLPQLLIGPADVTEKFAFLTDWVAWLFSSNLTLFWSLFWVAFQFWLLSILCVLYSESNLFAILDDGKWCVWLRSRLCWLLWCNRWSWSLSMFLLPACLYGRTILLGKAANDDSATFWTSLMLEEFSWLTFLLNLLIGDFMLEFFLSMELYFSLSPIRWFLSSRGIENLWV